MGRALMTEVLARATAAGHPDLVLWVLKENAPARRFYERAGFRTPGSSTPATANRPVDSPSPTPDHALRGSHRLTRPVGGICQRGCTAGLFLLCRSSVGRPRSNCRAAAVAKRRSAVRSKLCSRSSVSGIISTRSAGTTSTRSRTWASGRTTRCGPAVS
ncbi:GNAT family N-acetyltransferase [Streptomyces sp. IBSBF 3010]|uniref:GNAT family N-acetyltransferase n=1 Tax=Streptomyces sp. IBSBF 3010 TaxID=2903526 RepID=UPI003FA7CA05